MNHFVVFLQRAGAAAIAVGIFAIVFFGAVIVSRAFQDPSGAQPSVPANLVDALDVGSAYQEKAGAIGASDFYIANAGRWASAVLRTKIAEKAGGGSAIAYCPVGYQLLGCSGTGIRDAASVCPEDQCGYVGTVPVDRSGNRTTANPAGCKAGVDGPGGSMRAIAYAYCVESFR